MSRRQAWGALCCAGARWVWGGERAAPLPIQGTCGAGGPCTCSAQGIGVLLAWGRESWGLLGVGWMPRYGAEAGAGCFPEEGRYQRCHTAAAPFFLGSPPLLCSPLALVPPGAQGTITILLSQDGTPLVSYSWSSSNTTEHGVLLSTCRSFCQFFSPLFSVHSTCPFSSSSSLLHHPLHHPPHLCFLCPSHGSGHKDTACDLPAELLRGCSGGERGPRPWGHYWDKVPPREHGGSTGGDRVARLPRGV